MICSSLRSVSAGGTSLAKVPLVRVETRDFVDVAARARELGCRIPFGIALLPGNFATAASAAELRYHKAAPEVRSAWRRIGLADEGPDARVMTASAGHGENGDCPPENRDATALSPTQALRGSVPRFLASSEGLSPFSRPRGDANTENASVPLVAFFGHELRGGPARLVTYALGAVASVLSAYPGEAGASEIRFDAVVERPGRGGYACIECRGDACELVELAGAVREILMGNPSPGTDDDEGV